MADQSTTLCETERKYETDEYPRLPDPFQLLGSAVESDPQPQEFSATYFDTADLRLLRAGITLRRRTGGRDAGWDLKLPVDADSTEKIRLPLTGGEIPAELIGLTRLAARGRPVVPVAQLETTRRRVVLSGSDGEELAEVVTDEVRGILPDSDAPALHWREIEVELGSHGSTELLDLIEHELVKAGARRSAVPSKLARVLGARLSAPRDSDPRIAVLPAGSAGAVVLDYLAERAEQIRANDPGVRRDLPDAVHQMRVGCREMRSALQAFGRVLDPAATRGLVEELKWLGGELAPARDTEVVLAEFTALIDEVPDQLVLGPVRAHLVREMSGRAREGRDRALAALDSDRYLQLHGQMDTLLADPPCTRHAARPARKELPRGVSKAFRRTSARMATALAQAPGDEQDLALHEARKAAKRLRYAAELAASVVPGRTKSLLRDLHQMHKLLGAHQDAVVARPVLRSLAVSAHQQGANGFTFGLLHAEQTHHAHEVRRELPSAWAGLAKRFDRGPFRI